MTTWDSTAGFHTEGFFEVDGVDEIIDEEDAAGISGTAQIVIEVKAQAGSGDTDPFELIDHSAVASTGLDFLNNNGVIMVEVHAGTEVSAIGYPQ
jgi:hypothetical protein